MGIHLSCLAMDAIAANARIKSAIMLVLWMIISFMAAAIGNVCTSGSVREWYPAIAKPDWTPPSWVFGPVWTALYFSLGVAAWLVWKEGRHGNRLALTVFMMQLALNAMWSVIFFGWRQPGWAAVEIVVLWLFIVATVILFGRVRPLAGLILVPYLLWASFASVLNIAIWRLNR